MGQGGARLGSAGRLIAAAALLQAGCAAQPPGDAQAAQPVLSTKQLMEWVIDPGADAVWESVKTIITEKGTQEIAPQTQEQWEAVRNGAATLEAGADLMMREGYARDRDEWMSAARRLVDTAARARAAAEAKDAAAVFASGGEIYNACSACHRRYAPHLNAN